MVKYILLILTLLYAHRSFAQEQRSFEKAKTFYITGNTQAIGNTILGSDKERPFKDFKQINDEFDMEYIDIDDDASTFSSSSAFLEIPPDSKIVYAGLYWTGTYGYEKSVLRRKGDKVVFKGKKERNDGFNTIKFGLPSKAYQEIEGMVLYDGAKSDVHKANVPYICYKDVTAIVNQNALFNGAYTVANVRATRGFISGGSCGGWFLYVVYEEESAPAKYITTYHGFQFVNKRNDVEIVIEDFETIADGDVNTSMTVASLEGDLELFRDQAAIWSPQHRTYIPLENELRAKSNFFNSTISRNGIVSANRNPNVSNTLGFDIAQLDIENRDNALISNGANQIKLKFTTNSDRYYLFFTAFETELDSRYFTKVTQDAIVNTVQKSPAIVETLPIVEDTIVLVPKPKVETQKPIDPVVPRPKEIKIEPERAVVSTNSKTIQRLLNKKATIIPEAAPGYYVVTNVFSKPQLAAKWKSFLESKDDISEIIQNPENNWFYVYIASSPEASEAVHLLEEASQKSYLKDLWIFKVNID